MFPLFKVETEAQELAQMGEAVLYMAEMRRDGPRLDIVFTGTTPGDDKSQAADTLQKRAEKGATWWLGASAPYLFGKGFEGELPVEALVQRVLQGPLV